MTGLFHSPSVPDGAGLTDLRQSALRVLTLGVGCLGFMVVVATGIFIQSLTQEVALIGFALVALAVVIHRLSPERPMLAAMLLVLGLVVALIAGLLLRPNSMMLAWMALPAAPAATLVGRRTGLLALVIGSALIASIALGLGLPSDEVAMLGIALPLASFLVVSVLWRALDTALGWAWSSYSEVQNRTAELRLRQSELIGVNRSMEHAYQRLEEVTGQLERARRSAEEARQLKTEFAASVSHELRTPVSLIVGLSELMVMPHRSAPPLPDYYRAEIEAIYRNASHISNLVDDVLDLSQVDAHGMTLVREWVQLPEIVTQAAAAVETLFHSTGLQLNMRFPDDLPPVFVDPLRIREIMINLMNNAVRFTEEGGVTIGASVERDQIVLEVVDTGVGIASEDLPSVFRDFWRPGEPLRGRRGSGLGLAVSKRFAELHGGNMWVNSLQGSGSTFSLGLPLGDKTIVQAADLDHSLWGRIEARTDARSVILFVDPDPSALRAFRRQLESYEVLVAPSVRAAAGIARSRPLRAVIVGDAKQAIALERALGGAAGSLLIIACPLRTPRTIARELGVSDFVVKPVSQARLRQALRRLGRGLGDLVVADDDPDLLRLLCRMVERLLPDCRVRPATNGREVVALVRMARPDGLLLDMRMPELDGTGVIATLRADPALSTLPIAVLTGRGAVEDSISAHTIEFSRAQGFSPAEIARWMRAMLEGAQPNAFDRPGRST